MIEVRHDDPKENAMTYTHHLTLDQPYAQAVESVRAALSEQGFGIITEIDMRATFAKKLDADAAEEIGDYIILGACNPSLARRAPAAEPQLGALLPCNVIVRAGGRRRPQHRRGDGSEGHGPSQRQRSGPDCR